MTKIKTSPNFEWEDKYSGIIAGIDEAGRGPLAGPVVAAAVILDRNNYPLGLNDSKKLSAKRRTTLYAELQNTAIIGVSIIEATTIDQINILQATYRAMSLAVEQLPTTPQHCLIDGNRLPPLSIEATAITKGDMKSLSIAAASIIAKVTRDQIMTDLHQAHPEYGWDRNMGYGTKAHIEAIQNHGPTPYHRMSFAPLKVS